MAPLSVEEILAPTYVAGVTTMPLDDVRRLRDRASEVETGLSYLRRVAQGRLDIVLAEQQRRALGLPPEGLGDRVDRLPEILGDHVHAPGMGRLTSIMAPGEVDAVLMDRIEMVAPTDSISSLPEAADERVVAISAGLEAVERDISAQRRALHEVIDVLQEEIVRRYRDGEASVDSLLA
jgi:hypothetical protein